MILLLPSGIPSHFTKRRGLSRTPSMTNGWSTELLVIICVLSTALFAALVALLVAIFRARTKDRKLRLQIEQGDIGISRPPAMKLSNMQTTKPRHVLRRSTFLPFGSQSGWNILNSREDLSKSVHTTRLRFQNDTSGQKRGKSRPQTSWRLSKGTATQTQVPPDAVENTRLPAVIESPALLSVRSPGSPRNRQLARFKAPHNEPDALAVVPQPTPFSPKELYCSSPFAPAVKASNAESLKPEPLTVSKRRKRYRAQTAGTTIRPVVSSSERRYQSRGRNSASHNRSLSLGSQNPGVVPQTPAPPLPPSLASFKQPNRPRSWGEINSSRLSISSFESIGSSLLAASPRIQRTSSAWLKGGPKREYANSLITGPRPLPRHLRVGTATEPQSSSEHNLRSLRGSIQNNPGPCSVFSLDGNTLPKETSSNSLAGSIQLSPFSKLAAAETVRLNRTSVVSLTANSLLAQNTPRRQSKFLVTPNGSPAQRETMEHRDTSTNQNGSINQLSQNSSRASSTRSSNGNPFQFDPSPMACGRPSAMKGSPNARNRGHRRQNCVRISVPPQSKSPSLTMAGIQEESPEAIEKATSEPAYGSFDRSLPRPPSSATFAPDVILNPTLLRASLTPSSPTLSMVPFATEFSSREPSMPSATSSPSTRELKRHSKTSSIFTILAFPSPGKVTTNVTPTPTFSFTHPSNEFDHRSSPSVEVKRSAIPIALENPPADLLLQEDEQSDTSSGAQYCILSSTALQAQDSDRDQTHDKNQTLLPLFAPHPWTAPPKYKEKLIPISPPCSPKSISPAPEIGICVRTLTPLLGGDTTFQTNDLKSPDHSLPLIPPSTDPAQQPRNTLNSAPAPSGRTVVDSVSFLRRMNSEAERESATHGIKAMKTWQRLGQRTASPALDQSQSRCESFVSINAAMGATGNQDSMTSLIEMDRLLERGERKGMEGLDVISESGRKTVDRNRKLSITPSHATSGASQNLFLGEVSLDKDKDGESSAQKDREYSWQLPNVDAVNDLPPLVTTMNSQNRRGRVCKMAAPQRISQMRKSAILENSALMETLAVAMSGIGGPEVRVLAPSSEIGTPGSLYDENGFLKSS
jgi:hypothetical protein